MKIINKTQAHILAGKKSQLDPRDPIISVAELVTLRQEQRIVVLDAVMMPPGADKEVSSKASSPRRVIPGAQAFDIDREFSQLLTEIPHTLLASTSFQKKARALGIDNQTIVVVYDNTGVLTAPRVWWNFKIMGHEQVYVLDGGLPAWLEAGETVDSNYTSADRVGDFSAVLHREYLIDLAGVKNALSEGNSCVIDARSPGRFAGVDPEPRPGLPSGHMQGAKNLPFSECCNGKFFKSKEELAALFESSQCTASQSLIFTCGSGVTACVPLLAAYVLGYRQLYLYDGSWTEWAMRSQPVANKLN